MNGYIAALLNYPTEGVDGSKVLDALFWHYDTKRRIDSDEIRAELDRIYEKINHKPIEEITGIEHALYELINLYEMRGFKEGVKVGLLLVHELGTK